MEFAVIQTGGKQYRVKAGDEIKIEKILGKTGAERGSESVEYKEGDKIVFDKVLLVDNGTDTTIGTPFIEAASVTATITKVGRLPKVIVIQYKQKSRYFKKNGHKQPYFQVKIEAIK